MKLRIDKESEVPVHLQIREQIIFQISTGELPIGAVMPSVRELENRLKIHRNTIGDVYAELVRERWLVQRRGSRLVVVQREDTSTQVADHSLDALIAKTICLAREQGLSLSQLAASILAHDLIAPPNRLLIVEPERGMGEMMKCEVRKATGLSADSYSVPELRLRPDLLNGAILLVPSYLIHLLDFVPPKQHAALVPLKYSLFDAFVQRVDALKKPSVVGLISVTGPGLRTITGPLAAAINTRHEVCYFWLEWPPKADGAIVVRRLATKLLPPDIPVLVKGQETPLQDLSKVIAGETEAKLGEVSPADYPLASLEDLKSVDLLLCDSITYDLVKHPNRLKYQLLSTESLEKIAGLGIPRMPS
jgi:DNA-binding transcriptional regulator YhcF (GntR family)